MMKMRLVGILAGAAALTLTFTSAGAASANQISGQNLDWFFVSGNNYYYNDGSAWLNVCNHQSTRTSVEIIGQDFKTLDRLYDKTVTLSVGQCLNNNVGAFFNDPNFDPIRVCIEPTSSSFYCTEPIYVS
ncbi:hypothetical protein [Streptomyces melanogenes]|uniref:hypothetical protein n=1 Tax=Streptomyces melanogenes TaxID=67326 RepID=UPI00167E133B|nr:hypothetical protein [Streptomyces melanogenes]GGP81995.1 hypothetical protein GCM10010278_70860 [Streptomyces melanogenes]